jgi:hypothetical protein
MGSWNTAPHRAQPIPGRAPVSHGKDREKRKARERYIVRAMQNPQGGEKG